MARRPSLTLSICLAAGLAAGVGLARPGVTTAGADQSAAGAQTNSGSNSGYGSGSASDGSGQTPAQQTATGQVAEPAAIQISGFAYGDPLTVAPGTAIEVTNQDGPPHTVTADDGTFDTGNLGSGERGTITAPSAPGTYSFFCTIHPSMQGSITVTA